MPVRSSSCLHAITLFSCLLWHSALQAQTASNVYSRAAPSVGIVIVTTFEDELVGSGSAVTVASQTMVTNRHVLLPGHRYRVLINGARHEAYMTTCDSVQDLCLLSVNGLEAKPVEFGRPEQLAVGDEVYAIGAPNELRNVLGVAAATKQKSFTPLQLTLSNGLVTALRPVEDGNVIQTNAAISPGSSGGGLFDAHGRLVGITTFGMRNAQGLNMALPVNWVERLGVSGAPRENTAPVADVSASSHPTPRPSHEPIAQPVEEVPAALPQTATTPVEAPMAGIGGVPTSWLAAPGALLLLFLWRRSRKQADGGYADEPSIDPALQGFMEQAAREIDENRADTALWNMVVADSKGNTKAARESYIQRRAARLLSAEKDRKWAEVARQST